MNRKGQALVEFILILPIFIFMIMCIVDFSNVLIKKHALEGSLDYAVELYRDNKDELIDQYKKNNNLDISIRNVEGYTTIELSQEVDLYTPFITIAIDNPLVIKTSRVVKDA